MATTVTLKPNAIDISGATSGTTTLQATAVAGTTTLTLPAATDTLVGKATTDTLTNKTLTGAVMNGTLGATTPSTVAATSITASTTLGVTGVATFSAGTAALPAITTTGDTNTGMWFPAADTIAFSEGGVEAMRIDSSGNVGIGVTPTYKLDVSGTGSVNAQIAGSTRGTLRVKGSFVGSTDIGHFSVYNASDIRAFDIATTSDDTATPTSRAEFAVSVAGVSTELMRLSGGVGAVFNEDGGDYDFRVESDTNANAFFVEGSSGNVGIGTASPQNVLHVSAADATLRLTTTSDTGEAGIEFWDNQSGTSQTAAIRFNDTDNLFTIQGNSNGTIFLTPSNTFPSASEAMRITSTGNVGIGTSSPSKALDVAGEARANFFAVDGASDRYIYITSSDGLGECELRLGDAADTDAGSIAYNNATNSMQFRANAAERMRIDSAGNVQVQTGAVMPYAPAPTAIAAATTLTNANIQGQIISATGTTYTITMPLGTTLETLATWVTTGIAYDFFVINTASGTVTMAVNTGVTALGTLTIATGVSAQFRIRRTAANTFVLYRLG